MCLLANGTCLDKGQLGEFLMDITRMLSFLNCRGAVLYVLFPEHICGLEIFSPVSEGAFSLSHLSFLISLSPFLPPFLFSIFKNLFAG